MSSSMFGYGSHSFLNKYIIDYRCKKIMEIGVADGENALSMIRTALRIFLSEDVEYYGFDLFFNRTRMDKIKQKLKETGCKFKLFQNDSVETLPLVVKTLPKMDLIFIDGGHSYATVRSDWKNSKSLMHDRTAVFFHNYNYSGVKQVVDNIYREEYFVEIIHPSSDYDTAFVICKASI